jgi:alpha-tubulin suppressor-like RCC1 family protein
VIASGSSTCAILTTGELDCWGTGDLGTGDSNPRLTPTLIIASGVSQVSIGASHSCAVLTSGAVECWGTDYFGELGDNQAGGYVELSPVTSVWTGATQVAVGVGTCTLLSGGAVSCVGAFGGDFPGTPVTEISNGATQVLATQQTVCAVVSGSLQCWGSPNGTLYYDGSLSGDAQYQGLPDYVFRLTNP